MAGESKIRGQNLTIEKCLLPESGEPVEQLKANS